MRTPSKYIRADRDLTALSDPRANPTRQIYKPRYARRAFGPPRFARNKEVGLLCLTLSLIPFLILPYFSYLVFYPLLLSPPNQSHYGILSHLISYHLISSHIISSQLISSHLTSPHLITRLSHLTVRISLYLPC